MAGIPEHDVDRLYQGPLSEFTSARDAMAKTAGAADKAAIKRLQKPNAAAWAVNQLYWHERGAYEALVAAAQRLRAAQIAGLAGTTGAIARAETEHTSARKIALERIRRLMTAAGEQLSPATQRAIVETLDALPTGDPPGRLARPLKPMGFEGLAGLLASGGTSPRPAAVLSFTPQKISRQPSSETSASEQKRAAKAAKLAADARAKHVRALTADLHEAEAKARASAAAFTRARAELASARQARERLSEQLETATARVSQLANEIIDIERDATAAASIQARVEMQLRTART